MASWRLGVVGQSQCHASGECRLRHERAALPVPPYAEGRGTGLIAAKAMVLLEPKASCRACRCAHAVRRTADHIGHPANGGREGRIPWQAKTGGRLARLG